MRMVISDQDTKNSFEDNWEKYYNKIFRRVIYITGNKDISEDITQEVFAKLYSAPPGHYNVEAWLKRVSTNMAYNFIRNENLKLKKNGSLVENIDNTAVSAEDNVVDKMEYMLTNKILNLLKPNEKLCLVLKFSGYKYNEIAEVLSINKNSVGKIIARAQEKFKKLYFKEVEKNGLQR